MEIPEILAAAFLCGCQNKLIKDRAGTDNEQNFCYNSLGKYQIQSRHKKSSSK